MASRLSQEADNRPPETVPLAEQGMASCGGGSYPQPREARDPVRQALRPGREELAARIRRKCRRWKHGTPAENRHGGAPRGARPSAEGRKAPRKRLACRAKARSRASWTRFGTSRVPLHPSAVSALRHPSGVDEGKVQTPDAMRRGNEKARVASRGNAPGLFDIVKT